jgi:hypothetical protein
VRFRITRHSGYAAPDDAMERLLRRLGHRRNDVTFAIADGQIVASSEQEEGDREDRESRIEVGRRAVFDILDEACRSSPELESDWYAVSYAD